MSAEEVPCPWPWENVADGDFIVVSTGIAVVERGGPTGFVARAGTSRMALPRRDR